MAGNIEVNVQGRIIHARVTGLFNEPEMREVAVTMNKTTDRLQGKRHIVIADMRGFKTLHPSLAAIMGESIGYGRRNGCVLCLHVSDDTVQRLQAARIARQNSPYDDVTVDVESLEEAERLAELYEKFVDDPKFTASIRNALPA